MPVPTITARQGTISDLKHDLSIQTRRRGRLVKLQRIGLLPQAAGRSETAFPVEAKGLLTMGNHIEASAESM
jgi:hypothetical protein